MAHIEKRPEAIEAIKKCIDGKWNPICMGCGGDSPYDISCALCSVMVGCHECPLGEISPDDSCIDNNTEYSKWYHASSVFNCENCSKSTSCAGTSFCNDHLPSIVAPEEAEAMLEALVMLLPPEHRKKYGG